MTEEAGAVVYRCASATIRDEVRTAPGLPGCFRRLLRVRNSTGRTLDLTGAIFRLHFRVPEETARWTAQSFVMAETTPGGTVACAAFTSSEDRWEVSSEHDANGVVVTHTSHSSWRLAPGGEALIGTQYFWAVKGGVGAARNSTSAWYNAVGLRVLELPEWIRDAVLFEAVAGPGPPLERHRPESVAAGPSAPSAGGDPLPIRACGLEVSLAAEGTVIGVDRLPDGAAEVRVDGGPDARVRLQVDGEDLYVSRDPDFRP